MVPADQIPESRDLRRVGRRRWIAMLAPRTPSTSAEGLARSDPCTRQPQPEPSAPEFRGRRDTFGPPPLEVAGPAASVAGAEPPSPTEEPPPPAAFGPAAPAAPPAPPAPVADEPPAPLP